jgi:foldase protein PrsA
MTAILRNRRFAVLLACCAAVLALAAGCGGSSSSSGVPKGDIAMVGGTPITKARFDEVLAQYNASAKAAGQAPVKCCNADYTSAVQQKIVPYLVQRTEFEVQAHKLGVVVTPKDIDAAVKKIIDQYFKGKKSAFLAAIKKQGSTLNDVRDTVGLNVLQEKVTAKLTAGIKVSDAEALAYYNKNKSQYAKPTSRDLSHILVKTKALAQKIYDQLKAGADFAKLAKKYSTDKSSGIQGGKLGVQAENALVTPFSKVAFAIPTGTISKPVHTQFGWHIIKANGPVIPKSTASFSKEKPAIVQQLLQVKKGNATSAWQTKIQKIYAGKVKYASKDYAPPVATTPGQTTLFPTTPSG